MDPPRSDFEDMKEEWLRKNKSNEHNRKMKESRLAGMIVQMISKLLNGMMEEDSDGIGEGGCKKMNKEPGKGMSSEELEVCEFILKNLLKIKEKNKGPCRKRRSIGREIVEYIRCTLMNVWLYQYLRAHCADGHVIENAFKAMNNLNKNSDTEEKCYKECKYGKLDHMQISGMQMLKYIKFSMEKKDEIMQLINKGSEVNEEGSEGGGRKGCRKEETRRHTEGAPTPLEPSSPGWTSTWFQQVPQLEGEQQEDLEDTIAKTLGVANLNEIEGAFGKNSESIEDEEETPHRGTDAVDYREHGMAYASIVTAISTPMSPDLTPVPVGNPPSTQPLGTVTDTQTPVTSISSSSLSSGISSSTSGENNAGDTVSSPAVPGAGTAPAASEEPGSLAATRLPSPVLTQPASLPQAPALIGRTSYSPEPAGVGRNVRKAGKEGVMDPSDLLTPYIPFIPVAIGTVVIGYLLAEYFGLFGPQKKRYKRMTQIPGLPLEEHRDGADLTISYAPYEYIMMREGKGHHPTHSTEMQQKEHVNRKTIIDIHLESLDEYQNKNQKLELTNKGDFLQIIVEEFMREGNTGNNVQDGPSLITGSSNSDSFGTSS